MKTNNDISLLEKNDEEINHYAIGVISNEGYFTKLTEKDFKTEKEAYEYAYENIAIKENSFFSIHVQRVYK